MRERETAVSGRRIALIAGASAAAVLILAFLWLYGYCSRKSSDNLPGLSYAAEMEEGERNAAVIGYRRAQLEDVWGKPDQSEEREDRWKLEDGRLLCVWYDQEGKAVECRLDQQIMKNLSGPPGDSAGTE